MIGSGSSFPGRQVRSLFVSDVHLGSRHSKVESLLVLLQHVSPEKIYLVGDLLDGWQLGSRWRWQPCYHQLLHRLMEFHRGGTEVVVVAGNHDEFLRNYVGDWGPFQIVDATTHTCADGRELLVIHGDQFDSTQQRWPRLARIAGRLHEWMLEADALLNRLRSACGLNQFRLNAHVTNWFKHRIDSHRVFEHLSSNYARDWVSTFSYIHGGQLPPPGYVTFRSCRFPSLSTELVAPKESEMCSLRPYLSRISSRTCLAAER